MSDRGVISDYGARRWWWAVLLIAFAGLAVRLTSVDESLGWDEVFMRFWVNGHSLGETLGFVAEREKTPPLGFVTAWLSGRIGPQPEWIRLPSMIAGVALIPMTAIFARRVFNAAAGIVAALLVAASPFMIYHSVEARAYALVAALCLGATLLALAAVERGRAWRWAGYGLLCAAALLTHYIAIAFVATQLAWLLLFRPASRRPALLAQIPVIFALVTCAAFLSAQLGDTARYLGWVDAKAPLTVDRVLWVLGQASIGQPSTLIPRVPGSIGLVAIAAGFVIAALTVAGRRPEWPGWKRVLRSERGLALALSACGPLLVVGVTLLPDQSILMARNVIPSVPAFLACAAGLIALAGGRRTVLAAALVVAGLALGTWKSLTEYQRPQFKAAAEAVVERWAPDQPIVEVCCFPGQEGMPGASVATHMPARVAVFNFRVLTAGGDRRIAAARREGLPVFLIWRRSVIGPARSLAPKVVPGADVIWEREWPGSMVIGAGEYRWPEPPGPNAARPDER